MEGLDGLVIPGGESTTIVKGIDSAGLEPAMRAHHEAGRPILGTCAGLIVCDAEHLGFLDASARRNAFGRQLQSFEADLEVRGSATSRCGRSSSALPGSSGTGTGWRCSPPMRATRWRCGEGTVLASAFHPELTDDPRFHAIFMAMTTAARERAKRRRRMGSDSRTEAWRRSWSATRPR